MCTPDLRHCPERHAFHSHPRESSCTGRPSNLRPFKVVHSPAPSGVSSSSSCRKSTYSPRCSARSPSREAVSLPIWMDVGGPEPSQGGISGPKLWRPLSAEIAAKLRGETELQEELLLDSSRKESRFLLVAFDKVVGAVIDGERRPPDEVEPRPAARSLETVLGAAVTRRMSSKVALKVRKSN